MFSLAVVQGPVHRRDGGVEPNPQPNYIYTLRSNLKPGTLKWALTAANHTKTSALSGQLNWGGDQVYIAVLCDLSSMGVHLHKTAII